MTKFAVSIFFILTIIASLTGQNDFNLTLLSNPDDPCQTGFNDVWGFKHSNGIEYAVLGSRCGISIYDLSDPSQPVLIHEVPGAAGVWRDMKSRGDRIYVVADQGNFGIQVVNMISADSIVDWTYHPVFNGSQTLQKAHNLYIDDLGFLYIAGGNINNGGVVIFDLNQSDSLPPIVGNGPSLYAHDVYVNEARSMMVTSDIYDGFFTLHSLDRSSTPIDVEVLSNQETGTFFTHNTWTSSDGNTVYTTDERNHARVESYDISDPDEIRFLGEYAPATNLSHNVIPHNVHVKGDHLIISYYSEGIKVVDVSQPDIPVEIGSHDTHAASSGFSGAWGAFPFFSSDLILGSDMTHGLFVFQPDYSAEVGYLRGQIMDQEKNTIDSALIRIYAIDSSYQFSRNGGQFGIGLVDQSTMTANNQRSAGNLVLVRISRTGYETKDTIINFIPGSTLNHNFILNASFLPVELIDFSVNNINCENKITWTVGAEINHSHFELQTSQNGMDFFTLANINPEENHANIYSFIDENISDINYYRLKQVDLDGSYEFSRVITQSSHCKKEFEIMVYPNPVFDFLKIESPQRIKSIRILNDTGKIVLRNIQDPTAVNVKNLIPGIYFLNLETEENTEIIRFFKTS